MDIESETTYGKTGLAAWLGGLPYAGIMRLRRWAFHVGFKKSSASGVPVICVGNVTTGGTGKTPMVVWVVRQLVEMGRVPAILTRGYKSVNGLSDEAELLRELTGAKVIVNPDRLAGAKSAIAKGADVLVMDDGFQHMRLKRDLDIVLVDATNPFGAGPGRAGCCLPMGRLREPTSALRDAHVIIITRKDRLPPVEIHRLTSLLIPLTPSAVRFTAAHQPVGVIDETGQTKPLRSLSGKNVFAFCGLGNPEAFLRSIVGLGANVVDSLALDDHANYTPQLVDQLCRSADKCDAEILLTTQKDGIKLEPAGMTMPLWQLVVEMNIDDPQDKLREKIQTIL